MQITNAVMIGLIENNDIVNYQKQVFDTASLRNCQSNPECKENKGSNIWL